MLFFDMDGVLSVNGPDSDFEPDPATGVPPFARRHARYFESRPCDPAALAFMAALASSSPEGRAIVLSTLTPYAEADPALADEHRRGKSAFLARNCALAQISVPTLLFAYPTRPKPAVAAAYLARSLFPGDVLVDDFNDNLVQWRAAGGTAVKWLNGRNDAASWDGPSVSAAERAAAIPSLARRLSMKPPRKSRPQRPPRLPHTLLDL